MAHPLPSVIRSAPRRRFDQLGVGLAGLCALHCLLSILFVSGFAVGGHFLLAPEIHRIGLVLAIAVAALAIGWGALVHRRAAPLAIALAGLALMGVALILPHGQGEFAATLVGVALVAAGHLINLRAVRRFQN
ncbi:MAG: MerC domain-containing protein [Erythrobacter sp.]